MTAVQFGLDSLAEFIGPPWLREMREQALRRFSSSTLPTSAEEDWRYGRIDELDISEFAPARPPHGEATRRNAAGERLLGEIGSAAAVIRTTDGYLTSVEVSSAARAAGVSITSARELAVAPEQLGTLGTSRLDSFAQYSLALAGEIVVCSIPPGTELAEPILFLHEVGTEESILSLPRSLIVVGEAGRAGVVEFVVSPETRSLSVPYTEIDLGARAHLDYENIQQIGRRGWQLGYQVSRLAEEAELVSFLTAFGGDYARHFSETVLAGTAASSKLTSLYFGDGSQVQDLRTFQEHAAARTHSDLTFKGAVADTAQSVYTGLIHIHKGAIRSNAAQSNRTLVLSEGAHADSVPNLDIEENDVRCSHASAVGPLDPEQLYYLGSRGIPPEVAERLVLFGFFEELILTAPHAGVAKFVRDDIDGRLTACLGREVAGS